MTVRHLALAERHVAEGRLRIARQREIVLELQSDGRDLATAKALLAQFEVTQSLHMQDHQRIWDKLLAE